jgi:pimeloyl-ACP methyl ester carboxylesterase
VTVRANGIDLAYDTFGDAADPPLVLVMGLSAQRLAWSDEFCAGLAAAGRHVVRFDNRDVGESTHLHDLGAATLLDVVRRRPPYRLDDMADDLVGLLDGLGIDTAHVVGASLGGFIAQTAALRRPDRVRTLTLLMTSTGSRRVGRPAPRTIWELVRRPTPTSRDQAVDQAVATSRVIASPGYPFDEERVRELARASYDRAHDPAGARRQLAAILCQPDRTGQLRRLAIPTLVIHGLADPLIDASGGMAIAAAVPRARFVGYAGMGHDLPRALWPAVTAEITAHTG